jgi:NAD(P)-dependent dehydrogenase (short-subunit alcohol dehydrogenase family)
VAWLAEAKYLAARLGERGIRVITVSLGGTLTEQFAAPLQSRVPTDVPPDEAADTIPLGEFGDPHDAAYVVVYPPRKARDVVGGRRDKGAASGRPGPHGCSRE